MPQPLKRVMPKPYTYIGTLPVHDSELCMLAMEIIAEWSILEGALLSVITEMFPGRAKPIAEYYAKNLKSDGPKTAMIDGLAIAALNDTELLVFRKIKQHYETAYEMRNPIAHWILGY
jgi:hypothetical protein